MFDVYNGQARNSFLMAIMLFFHVTRTKKVSVQLLYRIHAFQALLFFHHSFLERALKVVAPVHGDSFWSLSDVHIASHPHQLPFLSHICHPQQSFLVLHTYKFKHRINVKPMENSVRSKDFKVGTSQLLQVFQHLHHLAVSQQKYTNGGNT